MDESLRIRKQKMLDRMRVRQLLAEGKLRPEQVCLAASAQVSELRQPLVLPKLDDADHWFDADDLP
jgi:hypothetical protein